MKGYINKFLITIKNGSFNNRLFRNIVAKIRLLIFYILSILASIDLKIEVSRCKNFEDYINLGLYYEYTPIKRLLFKIIFRTFQNKEEISKFIKIIAKERPKLVLEIGTARGGSLFLLTKFSNSNSHIISLDLPGGIHGGGYPRPFKIFYKSFKLKNQKITFIRKDSHNPSTLLKVKKIINKRKIDILFIDGDHTYNGVKKDFEMYSPLVKKNGLVAFHDITVQQPRLNCQVHIFWNEIKNNFDFEEIIGREKSYTRNEKIYGIGIIRFK